MGIRNTFVSGYLSDVAVRDLSVDECVVELRRLRAAAKPECEFADIGDGDARAALCRGTGECGCLDAITRETEIAKRLMTDPSMTEQSTDR